MAKNNGITQDGPCHSVEMVIFSPLELALIAEMDSRTVVMSVFGNMT